MASSKASNTAPRARGQDCITVDRAGNGNRDAACHEGAVDRAIHLDVIS